ncbi:acyl-CoA dehydrogenase family protein [Paraburkholderia madseniana]|uniref:Acyl-CoA dehydrogenase family protein n=1 Tax=Paraburkholderia madseniana TaxID=2599607 RepID=A0AAP5BHJ5_9BURK|nr:MULTISPECIES: acyl-CoA dehydrogenase family protein [Paraburkholderia]MCX4149660.1 acyl-CoA dehydrogenase family protein [Paraburkholderia madseniana]MDN7152596.1 acyl-CoA dehydrogenase family protein [Paraburkholderia sp. WS6]MDQ6411478.1 acyl-CoA dehydrogenase family protein [Paraburkholderia madseniana]
MRRTHFDADHLAFRDTVSRFFQGEIGPHAERWREQGFVDRQAFRKAGEQGYLLMWAPEIYGGLDLTDLRFEQILYEENVRHGELGFYINLHSRVVAPYLGTFGTDEQKARYLPPAIRGEEILAIAMTEPGAGSDLAGMTSRAQDMGDHWLLNGAKTYISNGSLADVVIVAARTVPGSRHGIGLFIVDAGMPGFRRGNRLRKIGLHAQDTAELFFDDVRVSKSHVLGDPTKGFVYMSELLAEERLQVAIGSIAHAQVAFDITLDFIKERKAFGRSLGSFQHLRFEMAGMRAQLDAAQALVDHCVMEANAGALTAVMASEAKLLATDLENRVIDTCVQFHGGAGYMEEYRIARMFADARVSRIFAGTNEIMKEIIGRDLGLDDRKHKQ